MFTLEQAVMDFVAVCDGKSLATHKAIRQFHHIIALAGYPHSVAGGSITLGEFLSPPRFYFNTLPKEWMALLTKHKSVYEAGLNGSRRAAISMEPFDSLSLQHGRKLTAAERKSYELTIGFGWRSIFVVPIHGPSGYRAVVAMLSKADLQLDARSKALLRLAALTVHDRCRLDDTLGTVIRPEPALTVREIACLREVALGESDKVIARKLSLMPSTVHDHIERARKKLGARTRAQAASLLVLLGRV